MISSQSLENTIKTMLGTNIPKNISVQKLADKLNSLAEQNGVELSAYGYVMWTLEHGGVTQIYRGALTSLANMDGYAKSARKYKEDMPTLLVNASQYVDKVFTTIQEPSLCMPRLEGMTFPYVLYVLFAAVGQEEDVLKYKIAAHEQLRRYPSTLDLLPDVYKKVGEELKNANFE